MTHSQILQEAECEKNIDKLLQPVSRQDCRIDGTGRRNP
jgi:hypothetical protein